MLRYVSLFATTLTCIDTGPEQFCEAPIALQLVGPYAKDEETLAMMEAIDLVLNRQGAPSQKN